MMKWVFFLIISLGLSGALFSQSVGDSPFASDINVTIEGSEAYITWKDSTLLSGETYHLFRFDEPITTLNFGQAEYIGSVKEGQEFFYDLPPSSGSWYYLITAKDLAQDFPVPIPLKNTTVNPITIDSRDFLLNNAVFVENLRATPGSNAIVITFDRGGSERPISLFRSTSPLVDAFSLSQAFLLDELTDNISSWRDTPIPGVAYYYAAIDSELYSNQHDLSLIKEGNHTERPVSLPLSLFIDNPLASINMRKAPLPTLVLDELYNELPPLGVDFPSRKSLSIPLEKRLSAFLDQEESTLIDKLTPHILEVDNSLEKSPITDQMRTILGQDFLKERWKESAEKLLALLPKSENKEITGRIHYYRGQSFYQLGEFQLAYLEFLLASETYFVESSPWLESCLSQLL